MIEIPAKELQVGDYIRAAGVTAIIHKLPIDRSQPFYIGELPGRKRIALYIIDGSVLTPLAYFRDREAAETAYALIGRLADALP